MKLSEFLWWPKEWTKDDIFSSHNTLPAQALRQAAFLAACKLTRHGLLLELDYYGETFVGRVGQPSINTGEIASLRDFFLEQIGESITSIEDLEVQPDRFH